MLERFGRVVCSLSTINTLLCSWIRRLGYNSYSKRHYLKFKMTFVFLNYLKLPWLYLTVLKTNAVNFSIDKYPKVLPFCEITLSNLHGNYWQKISENNKIHFCDPHKSRCIKCENGDAPCTLMKDLVISYQV